MVEEIVTIDKLIKFNFFYNSKDATTSIVDCKPTSSRPLALLSLLFKLFYFRHRILTYFSLFRYHQVITHRSLPKTQLYSLLAKLCKEDQEE